MTTNITLKEASQKYLDHLKAIGKKTSTIGTTRRTLDLLIAKMGEAKEVGKILPLHVDKFFKSDTATTQPGKDGAKPRAEASMLQIKRIVRSAIVWWHEENYSKTVALPKNEKRFLEPKVNKIKQNNNAKTPANEETPAPESSEEE